MSEHTPGPWEADIRSGVVAVFRAGDERNCLAGARDDAIHYSRSGAAYVEEPHGHWTIPDEVVANARLIAAAPELLEALEAVRGRLEDDAEWPGHSGAVALALLNRVDAAIAKAKGAA